MSTAFPAAPPAAATGETFAPSAPVSNRTRRTSSTPMPNRLNAWLSAAIVALMLLGTVGGAWWLGPGGSGPSDDGRTRLAAVTQEDATPIATSQTGTDAPAKITDLLAAVPAEIPGATGRFLPTWIYADIEQRFADLGISSEDVVEDPLAVLGTAPFGPLAHTTSLFDFSADEEFVAAIGFNPLTIRQVVVAGAVPDLLTVVHGDWDTDTLTDAWESSGYTEYTTEGGITVWTLDPNGMVDPAHPIQGKMFQQLNNVAILDGGILVYASTMETLELAVATHAGEVESARDDAEIAPLLATLPENTLSIIAMDQPGTKLFDFEFMAQNPNIAAGTMEEIEAPFVESREAVGPMPNYHGAIFGITSESGENGGEVIVRLGADSEEDAAQMVTVIEWRWEHFLSAHSQRPLDQVLELTEGTADGKIVVLTLDPLTTPSAWIDLLNGNGLAPFAVDREDADASASPVATPES